MEKRNHQRNEYNVNKGVQPSNKIIMKQENINKQTMQQTEFKEKQNKPKKERREAQITGDNRE